MNARAHWLSLWLAFWLLATGVPEALPGDRFLPASWVLIFGWLPDGLDWLWPGLFISSGVAALFGARSSRALVVGMYLAGLAYFVWGSTSMWGWWIHQGGTIPGSAAYYLLAGTMALLASMVHANRKIEKQVAEVEEAEIQRSEGEPQ